MAAGLLVTANTGWGKKPRGLYCFDLLDGTLRWKHLTAPNPNLGPILNWIDEDRLKLVFGSYAPSNGSALPDDTDDAHHYLYAVDSHGQLLWRHGTHEPYSAIQPVMVTSKSLYAWTKGRLPSVGINLESTPGQILAFAPENGTVQNQFKINSQMESCLGVESTEDGVVELFATDREGYLYVLNEKLELKRKIRLNPKRYDTVVCTLIAATNLTHHSRRYFVFSTSQRENLRETGTGANPELVAQRFFHDNRIVVFDDQFNEVANYLIADFYAQHLPFVVKMGDIDGDQLPEILVLGQEMLALKFGYKFRLDFP